MNFRLYLAFLSILTTVPVSALSQARMQLLDDRREPIESPLEVCVVRDLERTCSPVDHGLVQDLSLDIDFLTIEGEDHGPLTVPRAELEWLDSKTAVVEIPRKATLIARNLPQEGAKLTVYDVTDADFRQPVLRTSPQDGAPTKVAAGRFLISLSGAGFAPDLRELELAPAQVAELDLRRRSGWSLVLRVNASDELDAVEGAKVKLQTGSVNLPSTVSPSTVARGTTSSSGLALFVGLREPIVDAVVEQPLFLEEVAPALSSSPGTFAFRDISLDRGGALTVQVFLDGEVRAGARCRLLVYERVPGSDAEPTELWSAATDREGRCRSERLREGDYILRVEASEDRASRAWIDLPVQIPEGSIEEVTARLERVVVEGTILRGTEPAAGYRVVVHDLEAFKPYARDQDATAAVEADEEGSYQVTLWRPGRYRLHVQNSQGTPAIVQRVELHAGSQTHDFQLAPHEIQGQVVDANQQPVSGASISLNWEGWSFRRASADENGQFAFALEEESGSAELTARSDGYFASDPVAVEVVPDQPPSPVVLVLRRNHGIEGRLVGSLGPVAGATVISYQEESFINPRWLGQSTTDRQGLFRVPKAKNGATRLFFTGPGCPLGSRVPPDEAPAMETEIWQISCAAAPAGLEMTLLTPDLTPRSGSSILLQRGGLVFPREVLATHLARARLPFSSDASGRLFLAGLEPGYYDLFLAEANSPAALRLGARRGFLATVDLQPGTTNSIEVVLQETVPKEVP